LLALLALLAAFGMFHFKPQLWLFQHVQGPVGVHGGHAFIVEAAVSVGGRNIKPGLNIHRFSNRIPLLFEVTLTQPPWHPCFPTLLVLFAVGLMLSTRLLEPQAAVKNVGIYCCP
jgi:hypothetical protein